MKTSLIFFILIYIGSLSLYAQDEVRYFGGESQVKAKVAGSAVYVGPVVITEEIFKAKDTQQYETAIIKENKKLIDSKKVAAEFLETANGHLYGGLSEGTLSF